MAPEMEDMEKGKSPPRPKDNREEGKDVPPRAGGSEVSPVPEASKVAKAHPADTASLIEKLTDKIAPDQFSKSSHASITTEDIGKEQMQQFFATKLESSPYPRLMRSWP